MLKTHLNSCCFFVSRTLTQWSCLSVRVQASQVDHVVVSYSLPMRCFMVGEVRDKVEVFDPLVGPIVCQLSCSLDFVILPPIRYRRSSCPFSLHFLMRLWLYEFLVARDKDRFSFSKQLVQYDYKVCSMLRMLLGSGPRYFYWVVASLHIDKWSCFQIRLFVNSTFHTSLSSVYSAHV